MGCCSAGRLCPMGSRDGPVSAPHLAGTEVPDPAPAVAGRCTPAGGAGREGGSYLRPENGAPPTLQAEPPPGSSRSPRQSSAQARGPPMLRPGPGCPLRAARLQLRAGTVRDGTRRAEPARSPAREAGAGRGRDPASPAPRPAPAPGAASASPERAGRPRTSGTGQVPTCAPSRVLQTGKLRQDPRASQVQPTPTVSELEMLGLGGSPPHFGGNPVYPGHRLGVQHVGGTDGESGCGVRLGVVSSAP